MQLIVLKSTVLALVAACGVYADVPSLRGSDEMVALGSTCEDGWAAGEDEVKRMWSRSGKNCDNIWGFQSDVDKMKKKKYPSSNNWRTDSYNQCAREGADAEVKKIEKRCLEDDSSQCTDLGQAAAEIIVKDNFCSPSRSDTGTTSTPDYKKQCKQAAYGICQGHISTVARSWCPSKHLSNNKLLDMQNKCTRQVNSMVPSIMDPESQLVASFDETLDDTDFSSSSGDSELIQQLPGNFNRTVDSRIREAESRIAQAERNAAGKIEQSKRIPPTDGTATA